MANTLLKTEGVQKECVRMFKLDLDDFGNASGTVDLDMPVGAVITGGFVAVIDNSDSAGTDTLAIGDSGTANRYMAASSIKAAAATKYDLVPTGLEIDGSLTSSLRITRAEQTGTPAAVAEVCVVIKYAIYGVANTTQG